MTRAEKSDKAVAILGMLDGISHEAAHQILGTAMAVHASETSIAELANTMAYLEDLGIVRKHVRIGDLKAY